MSFNKLVAQHPSLQAPWSPCPSSWCTSYLSPVLLWSCWLILPTCGIEKSKQVSRQCLQTETDASALPWYWIFHCILHAHHPHRCIQIMTHRHYSQKATGEASLNCLHWRCSRLNMLGRDIPVRTIRVSEFASIRAAPVNQQYGQYSIFFFAGAFLRETFFRFWERGLQGAWKYRFMLPADWPLYYERR